MSTRSPRACPISTCRRRCEAKVVVTGNPVRPAVLEAAKLPYPDFADGALRLLVTGGSQGARVMADIVPAAIAALARTSCARASASCSRRAPKTWRASRRSIEAPDVDVEIAPFFTDLPMRMAQAHLVIARSGASTVSELAVIGRPAILVPLPHALDGDQAANAAFIEAGRRGGDGEAERLHAGLPDRRVLRRSSTRRRSLRSARDGREARRRRRRRRKARRS